MAADSDSSDIDYEIEVPDNVVMKGSKKNKPPNGAAVSSGGRPLGPTNEKERTNEQKRGNRKRRPDPDSVSEDEDGDFDEFRQPPPVPPPPPSKSRKKAATPAGGGGGDMMDDSNLSGGSDDEIGSGENEPPRGGGGGDRLGGGRPQSKAGESSDEESQQNNDYNNERKKPRKRLSLRLSRAGSTAPSVAGTEVQRHDADTLKSIYATCMDLFQSHKITQENAFQLRFLDLMGEILDMPDFNKNDMLNAGRMLETGAKIYVCRVDKTRHTVLDLASTLTMQAKKKKANEGGEQNGDGQEGFDDGGEFAPEDVQKKVKNRGRRKMKEQRFIVDNEAKISLTLEDDTATPAMRRETLKAKFNCVGDEDKDFDYQSFFYENPLENPLVIKGAEGFDSLAPLSEAMILRSEAQSVNFMPFVHKQDWQSSLLDVWGLPLVPGNDQTINNGPFNQNEGDPPMNQEEIPQDNRSYVNDVGGDDFGHDDLEEANNANVTFVDEDGIQTNEEGMVVVNPQRFNSLKEFYNMYSAIKAKFGWCGPAFVKPTNLLHRNDNNQKKPRVRKAHAFIDFKGADWNSNLCKYDTTQSQKAVFDEGTIENWSSVGRIVLPFLGYECLDDDADFKYLDSLLEKKCVEDEAYVPPVPEIFRYFLDHRRNIIESMDGFIRDEDDDHMGQFVRDEEDYIEDAGFDIERHRDADDMEGDMGMDNGIHPENEGQINGPLDASIFPSSLGLLCMQSDFDPVSGTGDGDSVKFTKKPKPIDMHALKSSITRFLNQQLQLGEGGIATSEEELSVDLKSLIFHVSQTGDRKMAEHLTVSIILVGLMHVVVDKKLFVLTDPNDPANPRITKRGKNWDHKANIPMPLDFGVNNAEEDD